MVYQVEINFKMCNLLNIINTIKENNNQEVLTEINDSMHLRNDIGFSSLELAELTVRIGSEYDVDVFEDGLVFTIGEIKEKLNTNHAETKLFVCGNQSMVFVKGFETINKLLAQFFKKHKRCAAFITHPCMNSPILSDLPLIYIFENKTEVHSS